MDCLNSYFGQSTQWPLHCAIPPILSTPCTHWFLLPPDLCLCYCIGVPTPVCHKLRPSLPHPSTGGLTPCSWPEQPSPPPFHYSSRYYLTTQRVSYDCGVPRPVVELRRNALAELVKVWPSPHFPCENESCIPFPELLD